MTIDTAPLPWHSEHSNIAALASHLVNDEGWDAGELLDFIEKPWKFGDEWDKFQTLLASEQAALADQEALRDLRVAEAQARRLAAADQV